VSALGVGLGPRTRPESCLSDFAIERSLLGEVAVPAERAAIEQHLASCPACRSRRWELAAAPAQVPDPAFWGQAVSGPVARARSRSRRLAGGLAAAAALAAGLVLAWPPRPAERAGTTGERAKGGGLVLEVVARRADGRVFAVFDGTALRPGDAVRFVLTAPVAGHAAVLGLDGAGHVSLYAPATSEGTLPVAAGKGALPGSIVIDDSPGDERFIALLCEAMPAREALKAAGERALAEARGVPGRAGRLDLPCVQDALTIHKERAR
jgi:hypothetical protein